jgi:formyltetrahydrofolate synthetase
MSANGTPTAFQFDTFLTALQNAIGQGGKSDVRLAKHFVQEKQSKKVQFLQPSNDDMMKKVYAMAQKFMNYDANDFSSVWTKVVLLPKIKS